MSHPVAPYSVDGHINMVASVLPKYYKEVANLTTRAYLPLYLMRKHGRIMNNVRSHLQVWNAQIKEPKVTAIVSGNPISFPQSTTDKKHAQGTKGYMATDRLSEEDKLYLDGPHRIIDRYQLKSKELAAAMVKKLQTDFWSDQTATGNANNYVGAQTFLKYDAGSATAADRILLPSATYAELTTNLGSYGGAWSTNLAAAQRYNAALTIDYPHGQGLSEYDATSPRIYNWAATGWGTGSAAFEDNAETCFGDATTIFHNLTGTSITGATRVCALASHLFTDFKAAHRGKIDINQPFRDGDLGFPQDTLMLDGVAYMSDYAMPANEGVAFCPEHVRMCNVHPDLFKSYGPFMDPTSLSHLFLLTAYGNYQWLPKYVDRFTRVV